MRCTVLFYTQREQTKALVHIAAAYRPNQVNVWLECDKATKYIIVAHLLEKRLFYSANRYDTSISHIRYY